jgi:hypothetical protein
VNTWANVNITTLSFSVNTWANVNITTLSLSMNIQVNVNNIEFECECMG